MSTPTAYWPTPSLIRSLSRAGWGELGGRSFQGVRSTLRALADLLPDKTGRGLATAYQLAHASGFSERWTRRCLNILEDLGLIVWNRGGVIDGTPQPSFFEICKARLAELVTGARPGGAAKLAERRKATAERLATLKPKARIKRDRERSSRSNHAELSANLSTPKGGVPRGLAPDTRKSNKDMTSWQRKRAAFLAQEQEKQRQADRAAQARIQAAVSQLMKELNCSEAEAHKAYIRRRFA